MSFKIRGHLPSFAVVLLALSAGSFSDSQEGAPPTFQIDISLPSATIHVGEDLAIKITITNPTDHIVHSNNVIGLEILNEKGEDVGPYAMGADKQVESGFVLNAKREAIRSKSDYSFTWHPKLEPGNLAPGTFKVRIHKRDAASKAEVYSNSVVLNVIPKS